MEYNLSKKVEILHFILLILILKLINGAELLVTRPQSPSIKLDMINITIQNKPTHKITLFTISLITKNHFSILSQ